MKGLMPLALVFGNAICLAIDFSMIGQIATSPILTCFMPYLLRKVSGLAQEESLWVALFCALGGTVVALVVGFLTAPMMSGNEPTYAFAFGIGVFGYQAAPILCVMLIAFAVSLLVAKAKTVRKTDEF